jgi:hypothetical protein
VPIRHGPLRSTFWWFAELRLRGGRQYRRIALLARLRQVLFHKQYLTLHLKVHMHEIFIVCF